MAAGTEPAIVNRPGMDLLAKPAADFTKEGATFSAYGTLVCIHAPKLLEQVAML